MGTRPTRDLSGDFTHHLHRRYNRGSRALRFPGGDAAAFAAWQAKTRQVLLETLGGVPEAVPALELERLPVATGGDPAFAGLHLERLYYRTRADLHATAYLVLPERLSAPAPAVLCPPGHGGGMNQVVFEDPGIYHRFPLALAHRGMVCLVPEHLGFGERGNAPGIGDATHQWQYLSLVLLGENAMGYLLWDLRRALDVLAALPEVDAGRLACCGLSLGGEMTMFTAAADLRVRAAAICGFLTSCRSTYLHELHWRCGCVPGLACLLEHVDIAALIAPRPLLVQAGTRDPAFDWQVTTQACAELDEWYRLCGAEDRLRLHVFEGAHETAPDMLADWSAALAW